MKTISAADQLFSGEWETIHPLINLAYPPFVAKAIANAKMTVSQCASLMDMERQTLDKYLKSKSLSLAFVRRLPESVRVEVVKDLLPEQYSVTKAPPKAERGDCDYRFFAKSFRSVTEAVSVALEATSDGHLTRAEGAEIEALCDKAIGLLLTIREVAKMAQREGVVGLRSSARGGVA